MGFPSDFVWGSAAASYQIEGGAYEDGKGLSIWDVFCRKSGAIAHGDTGDLACDHYHRYRDDVALMKRIGLRAYRLSISWPRVLPEGTGAVNEAGMAFYDRLVDELLGAGIQPYVTLYHWDLPFELYCRGGWLNRDCADWFAEYTTRIVARLGDRVRHWMTFNEPQAFLMLGLSRGSHAPGDRLPFAQVLRAGHHVLLGHGKSVQAIRAAAGTCRVGWAPSAHVAFPDDPLRAEDVEAARQSMFATSRPDHFWRSPWLLDPAMLGSYPQDGWNAFGDQVPPVRDGDLETIHQPLDFLGFNNYSATRVQAGPDGQVREVPPPPGAARTAMGWPVTPEGLYWTARFLQERYRLPLYITENGVAVTDWPSLDGQVHDPLRIDFLTRYLRQLRRAIDDGVDVRGYFAWSIMDNFEWAQGYRPRFGLIHVDYPTQTRTLKDSAHWYGQVIAANGENL